MSVPSLYFGEENEEMETSGALNENIPQQSSLVDLHQIPGELWLTRRRIEAGVREQRKQREMLTNVQERLAQCRLERTKQSKFERRITSPFRLPRSHSPPNSSERFAPTCHLPDRPSTSHKRQQSSTFAITTGDEFSRNIFNEDESINIPERQFRNRLTALEQQMERLNLFTAQSLSSKLEEENFFQEKTKKELIIKRKTKELIEEFAKLKRKINQLRENTKLELKEVNSEFGERMDALMRQLKREIILLISSYEDAETRAELSENRLKEIFEKIWAIPSLNNENIENSFSSISFNNYLPSMDNLIIAIRLSIDRASSSSLEAYRAKAREELTNERLKNERELKNIEREAKLQLERRESEWAAERLELLTELENERANKSIESEKIEAKRVEMDKSQLRIQSLEEQLNRLSTELAAERNKYLTELIENNERFQTEITEYQTTIVDLEEQLFAEQKERQTIKELTNELKEAKNALNEELLAASTRLSNVETQLGIALQNTEEITTKLRREGRDLAMKLVDTEAEIETLKEQLKTSEKRLKKERDEWHADIERADKDWKAQSKLLTKAETQKKELIKELNIANSKLNEIELKLESRIKKEQTLRTELIKVKEELAEERIQAENVFEEKEKEFKKEMERLKFELNERLNELTLAIEKEAELTVKLEDAEHRLTKASELCKRLTKELDELSEKSFVQTTSTEKLLADLDEAKGEIIIYKGSLEEQKRRNIQLETEIRQLEKECVRNENIFEKWKNKEEKQKLNIKEDLNSLEILIKNWEEKIFGNLLKNEDKLTKRVKELIEELFRQNIKKINELENENVLYSNKLISEQQKIISNLKEEISLKNNELNKLLNLFEKSKNEKEIKLNEEYSEAERDWLKRKRILERRLEELEQTLNIERTENIKEIEKVKFLIKY
ncbi:unnamed protein product [Meloidogyne enterolobii]|uniref:Uncharacterized protein n=1 Tax=Meloidogyne enterolobii TaxID=390850 RepID=A0ACB0ZZJ4_MELEN